MGKCRTCKHWLPYTWKNPFEENATLSKKTLRNVNVPKFYDEWCEERK